VRRFFDEKHGNIKTYIWSYNFKVMIPTRLFQR